MRIILASSSPYRQALMNRLDLPFETYAPDVDESPLPDEDCQALALRLAQAKAQVGVQRFGPEAIIIGSDQVAEADGKPLGKPLTVARAIDQLMLLSGKTVIFHTAVSIHHQHHLWTDHVPTTIQMRHLKKDEVQRYVEHDQPLNSAGAMKTESLGIALMERFSSTDPTAIIGLPLITVCQRLRALGVTVP